jgi:two-component system, NarL family, response regulator LiaR
MPEPIKILVVDDHDMVRKGLKAYLMTEPGMTVVGEAASGREAVRLARSTLPDVILMDLLMEGGDGIEATREVLAFHPACKVIIVTSYYDEKEVIPAIEAGASGYLLKTAGAADITGAIRKAAAGQSVIEAKVARVMLDRLRQSGKPPHDTLTARELEVLGLIGAGLSNLEIGDSLYIGIKTVKTHVSSILRKLDLADRTQAAIYANKHGLARK